MFKDGREPGLEHGMTSLKTEYEIIPPEEDIANGEISIIGDQYDLVVADNEDPEKISS